MVAFHTVYFDEVKDVSQLISLYYLSLNWSTDFETFQEMRRNDDRYPPEFGLYAVTPDETVIGGVLLMEIPAQTISSKVLVGGISAVATRPGFQQLGVMTALVNRCHEYFVENQLDHCFLSTALTRVAHSFYEKMGYRDLKVDELGWKLARKQSSPSERITVTGFQEQDSVHVDRVFKDVTRSSCGFIYRPPNFLKARRDSGKIEPLKRMRLAKLNGEISGYAYWNSDSHTVTCEEILALDKPPFMALLADAENRFDNEFLAVRCEGLVSSEIDWLHSADFETRIPTYGVVMVRSLSGSTDLESIRRSFGVNKGLFRMGEWDST